MKVLAFQAERFAWRPHSKTIDEGDEATAGEVRDAVVAFVHAETGDFAADRADSVSRGMRKHLKWLANKRGLRTIVLHSFTHLGGETAEPDLARRFLRSLAERLVETGYTVHVTPFGWTNAWEISVLGDSLAKVWKSF